MRLFGRRESAPTPSRPRATAGGLDMLTVPDLALSVSRDQAMRLSVIANARQIICGIGAQLSVKRYRGTEELDPGTLLTQPDPDTTWSAQIGWTLDDLLFYGRSEWLVLRESEGYPTRARRLPPGAVQITWDADYSKLSRIQRITIGSADVAPGDVIRIESNSRGVLRECGTLLLSALELQAAADRFTSVPLPAGTLRNTGQEIGPEDAKLVVAAFDQARETGATAFLQSMEYERTQLSAADLQMVEARAMMDTMLARAMNCPVAAVGASPSGGATAQLYANLSMTLAALILQCVAPYLVAVEDSLTAQATPGGQRVEFDTEGWLRFATDAAPAGAVTPSPTPGGTP